MRTRNRDEWTINRWRTEPRWRTFEMDEPRVPDQVTPLWKDLALASAVAGMLWLAALAMFR